MPKARKKSTKATPTPKITPADITEQTDGRDYRSPKANRTLDELWGGSQFSKYETQDETVYASYLENLNKLDLQRECLKIGLVPNDERSIMTDRLMKQFRAYVASTEYPAIIRKPATAPKSLSADVYRILNP